MEQVYQTLNVVWIESKNNVKARSKNNIEVT